MDNISFTSSHIFKAKKVEILYKLEEYCNNAIPKDPKTPPVRFRLLSNMPDRDGYYKGLYVDGRASTKLGLYEEWWKIIKKGSNVCLPDGERSSNGLRLSDNVRWYYARNVDNFVKAQARSILKRHKHRVHVLNNEEDILKNKLFKTKLNLSC